MTANLAPPLPVRYIAALLDGSFDAVILREPDGTILSWNPAAQRIYGYAAGEAMGRTMDMVVPDAHWDEYQEHKQRVRRGEVIRPFETVLRRKDGSLFDVLVTLIPVRDEQGGVAAVWSMSQDISDRKAATKALEEREQQFREIAENFPGVIFRRVSWPDGRVEYPYVSNSIERYLSLPLGWPGTVRKPDDLLPHMNTEDLHRWQAALEEATARMTPLDVEGRIYGGDGQIRWVRSVSRPRRRADGTLVWDGVVLDVTDRKQAENRLREKSAQLETIMETVPAMIWLAHDPQADRITGSRYAAEYLRLSPESNQSLSVANENRPLGFRFLKDGEELAQEELPVQRAARGEEVREEELEVVFADGTSRWELVNASPIRDADGSPTGAVGAGIDITERKRAQEHQAMLMAELDHRVKNFLATVQALVRQTLTASPEAEALTGRIRALVIAHELLARGQWRGTSMHPLMTSVLQPYQTDPEGERIRMQGPDVRLGSRPAQTLMLGLNELATNALKYGALSIPSGYVDVRWEVSETPPTLSLSWQERNGPEVGSPQRRGFGSRLIEGSLAMESGSAQLSFEPDGLRCSIRLPLGTTTAEPPAAAEPQAPVAEYSGPVILQGKRVLVVEDEPLLAGLMEEILAGAGCGVVGPLSRLDIAVTTALREPVDAAILDVNLNGELVTPLAELLSQRNVPFVFVTGYGRLDALPQHLRRTTIVHKPVQEHQILSALAKAVQEQGPPRPRPL